MTGGGDVAFVGDVHLDEGDPDLDSFLAFLDALAPSIGRLVLMGDLFKIWIGHGELENDHHRAVADRLASLRRRGITVRYLEGNRDYRIAAAYAGRALDEATDGGIVERAGGVSVFAIHGDLANEGDRQYRTWRRLSRSRAVWALLLALPRRTRRRLAEWIEGRLRRTNPDFRGGFPETAVRAYAARFLGAGHDAVVLGHFHVEKDLQAEPPSPPGRILVLPEWKESRRLLRLTGTGKIRFEDAPVA